MIKLKNARFVSILVTLIVTSAAMSAGSALVYKNVSAPKYAYAFAQHGVSLVAEEKYLDAIPELEKACTLDKSDSAVKMALLECYIMSGDVAKASALGYEIDVTAPENAQKTADLLTKLNTFDASSAYGILSSYRNNLGDKLPTELSALYDSAFDMPTECELEPESGDYAKPFEAVAVADTFANKIGHSAKISVNSGDSKSFDGTLSVEKSSEIVITVTNPNGDVATSKYTYKIDTAAYDEIRWLLSAGREIASDIKVGTEVGCVVEGAKERMLDFFDYAEEFIASPVLTVFEAEEMLSAVRDAYNDFEDNIIVETDRTELEALIEEARMLYQFSGEGEELGEYRTGTLDRFAGQIASAAEVCESLTSNQTDIDTAVGNLKSAIYNLENCKNTIIDVMVRYYGGSFGTINVSAMWDTPDDADIYVLSPLGDMVFYGQPQTRSGGILDVQNGGETLEMGLSPTENIFWENAPSGTYTVEAHMFGKAVERPCNMQVQVTIDGVSTIYPISIINDTVVVCEFDYINPEDLEEDDEI